MGKHWKFPRNAFPVHTTILHVSRRGLPTGLALTGAVCSSQTPDKSVYFSHASMANTLALLDQGVGNGHSL